jgi:hypothetical protein
MPAPTDPANGPAIAAPVDWNNLGQTGVITVANPLGTGPYGSRGYYNGSTDMTRSAYDQPVTVCLQCNKACLSAPDAQGFHTTAEGIGCTDATKVAFPAGTTLRGVAIESYFRINGLAIAGDAVLKGVDGTTSTLRRQIVKIDNCNTCHERVGFHGENGRANNPDHCALCHNTEMTSSNLFTGYADELRNLSTAPATGFYEVSQKPNNFKDLVHSIHAAEMREVPFNFIRGNPGTPGTPAGGGNGPMFFEGVGYPARLADCLACHVDTASYDAVLPANIAWTAVDATNVLSAAGPTPPSFPAAAVRISPMTSACGSCHDSGPALSHMQLNSAGTDTCVLCHGPGKTAPVDVVHASN